MSSEVVNKICYTFESYFWDNIRGIESLKDKVVFVDEYTMTPNRFMTMLYNPYTKFNITVIEIDHICTFLDLGLYALFEKWALFEPLKVPF